MNLSEKTCLVTGTNTGLGFEVSKQMAAQGAKVIMVCRDRVKGERALSAIIRDHPNASAELMICNLASLESIASFIHDLRAAHSRLDVLYNNAAVMKQKRTLTEDGVEMMFQVNYLAPFILMNAFLPLLKKGSTSCIVNNGRPSDKLQLDPEDLQFQKGYKMYPCFFKTKLCLLFSSLELSKRPEIGTVSVMMIDPGPFKSDLVRDVPLANRIKNLISAPVEKASENLIYHLTATDVHTKNGKVFKLKKEYPLTEYWKDSTLSKRIWSLTETYLQDKITW